jgi:hypothetical protein
MIMTMTMSNDEDDDCDDDDDGHLFPTQLLCHHRRTLLWVHLHITGKQFTFAWVSE